MPIYEYRCEKCAHEYEKRQGFEARPVQKCPECGGKARRVIHAAPIVFKGSGFYVTDSRAPEKAETESTSKTDGASKDGADSSSKGGGDSSSKGDAKSASKEAAAASSKDGGGKSAKPASTS